jgi:hypothetical protein
VRVFSFAGFGNEARAAVTSPGLPFALKDVIWPLMDEDLQGWWRRYSVGSVPFL